MTKNIDELNAMNAVNAERAARPRRAVPVEKLFGIECPNCPQMGVFTACAERDREAIPARDPHYVFRDAPETRRVLSALEHAGAPAYLVGPTGCGKTTLIEQACARLGRPVTRVNLDGSLGRGDLVGLWVFKEDQSMSFQHGPVATAIRDGHVLILDEIDVANPSVLLLLQACLEGRPFKVLETGETIAPHPDFRLFATANTIGRGDGSLLYRAAQAQNFALLDRFRWFLAVGYPDEKEEMRILRARFGEALPEGVYKMLVQTAAEIRRAHQGEDCEAPMSTRAVIDIARDMVEFRCPPREAFGYRLLNRLSPQDREVCENLMAPVWGSRLDLGPDEDDPAPPPAPKAAPEKPAAPTVTAEAREAGTSLTPDSYYADNSPKMFSADDAPIVKLANGILQQAAQHANRLRIAWDGRGFKVYHGGKSGGFTPLMNLPVHVGCAVIDRVKAMAGLDLGVRKISQSGRVKVDMLGGRPVWYCVKTEPCAEGENITLPRPRRAGADGFLGDFSCRSERSEESPNGCRRAPGEILRRFAPQNDSKGTRTKWRRNRSGRHRPNQRQEASI